MTDDVLSNTGAEKLKRLVTRIERLEEDRAAVNADLREVYAEAKGEGFDVKILRKVITERRRDAAKRQEDEAVFDLYWGAVQGELFDKASVVTLAAGRK